MPVDLDREVIRRLTESSHPFHKGLLLMRFTGIRVSELCNLNFDCTREDHNGRHYLKVPLGKLNNERMVPLDSKALEIVRDIQNRSISFLSGRRPEWLLLDHRGVKASRDRVQYSLRELCRDIPTDKPITSHRMRHTYATAMLNGGMSLVGVMRLLGHRSLRMTLVYAAVTQETVTEEYFAALTKIDQRYRLSQQPIPSEKTDESPNEAIDAIIRWLKRNSIAGSQERRTSLLVKRLHRFKSEIEELRQKENQP